MINTQTNNMTNDISKHDLIKVTDGKNDFQIYVILLNLYV